MSDLTMWCSYNDIKTQIMGFDLWMNDLDDPVAYVNDRIVEATRTAQGYVAKRYAYNIWAGWVGVGVPPELKAAVIALTVEPLTGRAALTQPMGNENSASYWERKAKEARKMLLDIAEGRFNIIGANLPNEIQRTGDGFVVRTIQTNDSINGNGTGGIPGRISSGM